MPVDVRHYRVGVHHGVGHLVSECPPGQGAAMREGGEATLSEDRRHVLRGGV
jgi:hypothetical protein